MLPGALSRLRLLLVDDDDVDRLSVRRALRNDKVDLEIVEADSAEAGLCALRGGQFDCVMLDYQMPKRDGQWFLRTARASGIDLPIVVLTGHGDEQTAVELMKAGASDYLPKSALSPDRLLQTLRSAIRLHAALRETQKAERALEAERERLRMALEAAALGTWDYDFLAHEVRWDDRCKTLFGLSQDAPITVDTFLEGLHPADRERVASAVQYAFDPTSEGRYDVEFRTIGRNDGIERWCRSTGRAFFENGYLVRFTGTIQDVGERKRAEEHVQRRAEFDQQLVGIVSHDLRNPISAMMMSAHILLKRGDVDPHRHKTLMRIVSNGDRAVRLIRDLLDFTQIGLGGGLPIVRKPMDLRAFVRASLEDVHAAFPDREIVFTGEGACEGAWDPDRITQILTNLLTNAFTYGPIGAKVRVSVKARDGGVLLEVHNEGEPIPAAILPTLFEPFKRGMDRRPSGNDGRSIGLGLYIVKQIVRAHGGDVGVESKREAGTTFRIWLPLAAPISA